MHAFGQKSSILVVIRSSLMNILEFMLIRVRFYFTTTWSPDVNQMFDGEDMSLFWIFDSLKIDIKKIEVGHRPRYRHKHHGFTMSLTHLSKETIRRFGDGSGADNVVHGVCFRVDNLRADRGRGREKAE
ncbi:hypothetical protein L1987_65191 [Smallanthus sonchifolius]|uniref:Uncharacterized protein n=1 Tax=Smallanthus sonchifolius TaxID=185202 RepID=A0ACB9BTR4_9ASTR|nr:hypothetical protein L1987_65191 [Smallanthus sonchifolius]